MGAWGMCFQTKDVPTSSHACEEVTCKHMSANPPPASCCFSLQSVGHRSGQGNGAQVHPRQRHGVQSGPLTLQKHASYKQVCTRTCSQLHQVFKAHSQSLLTRGQRCHCSTICRVLGLPERRAAGAGVGNGAASAGHAAQAGTVADARTHENCTSRQHRHRAGTPARSPELCTGAPCKPTCLERS